MATNTNQDEDRTALTVFADGRLKDLLKTEKLEELQKIVQDENTNSSHPLKADSSMWTEGKTIGKYIIIRRIGKGGMGEIYLAKHSTLGTYRALKVLPSSFQEDNAKFYDRFIREAKLASEIRHPNVVSVMDIETDPSGASYIVMEYIDGGSLRDILKSHKNISEEQSVIIVEAIASALKVAEEHNIVHRDIKPDNIMFTKQGEIKLADLGIAKNDEEDTDLTKTNMMIGTPAYLSPEQVQNAKTVDSRADIYSLGATFYEMLTGQHPYPGNTTYEIIYKLFSDPVPDPRTINPDISESTALIVMKMLAKNADDRFQNAAELVKVMEDTYPPRTENENREQIKKAIIGICENSSDFNTERTSANFNLKTKTTAGSVKKKSFYIYILCLITVSVLAGILLYRHYGDDARLVFPKQIPQKIILHRPEPPPASIDMATLTVHTTPDAEIKLKAENGALQSFSAGSTGKIQIPQLSCGKYKLFISGKHFIPVEREISLQTDMIVTEKLKPDVHMLTIRAIPLTEISISGIENQERALQVPENGILKIPDLLPGTILIRGNLSGYEPAELSVILNRNQSILLKQNPVRTSLRLKTTPYAMVKLIIGGKTAYSGESDNFGICIFPQTEARKYLLCISKPGYQPRELNCDLTSHQNITADLVKILFSVRLQSHPGAQIQLLLGNQLQRTYFVPDSGWLTISGLEPRQYVIMVEKNGHIPEKFNLIPGKVSEIQCVLKPQPAKPFANRNIPIPPAKVIRFGVLSLVLSADTNIIEHCLKNSLELKIGSMAWKPIQKLPFTIQLEPGIYSIRVRANGVQPMAAKEIRIEQGNTSDIVFEPKPFPASLIVTANASNAKFMLNSRWYPCGESIIIEPFADIHILVAAPGHSSQNISFRSTRPGYNETLKVKLDKAEVILSGNPNYIRADKAEKAGRLQEALQYFMMAANEGDAESMFRLAGIYDSGNSVAERNRDLAAIYYRKAADKGHPQAAARFAVMMLNDKVDKDIPLMIRLFSVAAKKKQPEAMYHLGCFYADGLFGMKKDHRKALQFLLAAAEQNFPPAMFAVAQLYEKEYEFKNAIKWYEAAKAKGISKAADRLKILEKLK